jgi:hypothetical protein
MDFLFTLGPDHAVKDITRATEIGMARPYVSSEFAVRAKAVNSLNAYIAGKYSYKPN